MATRNIAAVDLGASSGRVLLARFDGRNLDLQEVHRFPNQPVRLAGNRFWNILSLWEETLAGLRKARKLAGTLDSVGVDTWAVDYGLVDASGFLLGLPFQYRDSRTDGVVEQVIARIPRDVLYRRTGIQLLPFNTLFQLYAHEQLQPGELAYAHRLLLIPDLLHSWLSGSQVTERTNASTTQCWDPLAGAWASDLLEQLGIPASMLPPVVEAGTVLGEVLPEWRDELGHARVIAPATHDTGSAIAAAPAKTVGNWGYISSGTWSLVGTELAQPVTSEAALVANFTNEAASSTPHASSRTCWDSGSYRNVSVVGSMKGIARTTRPCWRMWTRFPPLLPSLTRTMRGSWLRLICLLLSTRIWACMGRQRSRHLQRLRAASWKAWCCAMARCLSRSAG